jgi:SAM-dependent methyltransferase
MPIDRSLKTTFGKKSRLYESTRIGYPEELIDDVIKLSEMPKDGKILDIGCGPGKATVPFAKRGYNILGVDISSELIEIAKENSKTFPNASYKVASFEQANLPLNSFNLITAAQSWHWIDPDIRYKRTHDLLVDSGSIAIFWKFQDRNQSDLVANIIRLYEKHCPTFDIDILLAAHKAEKQISSSKLFHHLVKRVYTNKVEYTKEKYLDLTTTFSYVAALSEEKRKILLAEISKVLESETDPFLLPLEYTLLVAKKK